MSSKTFIPITPSQVSLVIPTLNAAAELPALLGVVASQRLRPVEVLVVDSSSDDGTADVARSLGARVMQVDRAEFDHGLTRHRALLETSGEFVCFLTQDALPANGDYFAQLLAPFADPLVAASSGRQLPKLGAARREQLVRGWLYGPESTVRSAADVGRLGVRAYALSDACSAYRRSAYLVCGGFPALDTNEDMYMAALCIRAGYRVAYAPDACVYHSHNLTPIQQYRRNKAVGEFLETHRDLLACSSETEHGLQMATDVSMRLATERRPIELAAFALDCAARFAGNRAGRGAVRRGRA